jgi:hypothetical protein
MRKAVIIFSLLCYELCHAQQGINNNWLMGYYGGGGETKIDFFSGSPVITQYNVPMDFRHTHANISDAQGNMLFYTNGYYIADATNDTMQNGSGINPGAYANTFKQGFQIAQGALAIRKPGSNTLYYLFHGSVDNYPNASGSVAYNLKMTTIDVSLNNGLGAVVSKNTIMIQDTLNSGKITACKHANGRDWWVVVHRVNSNTFYKLLVTPNVILGPYTQNIGTIRPMDGGQLKFSKSGTKLAYYYGGEGLDLFDFNRCTGQLSNLIHDTFSPPNGLDGCEFSPNSNVFYASTVYAIYQYDLLASNVIASRTTVAVYDSFFQPGYPNLRTFLCHQQLAPDGKIYIVTGNGSTYLHTIDYPDVIGIGCNVNQHSVLLPTFNFNTLPNHPNYFLECDSTLGCLCASTTDLTPYPSPKERGVTSMPNPSDGNFTLQFDVKNVSGMLEIYDVMGKLVYKDYVSAWSQFKRVNITQMPKGIYLCKLQRGENLESAKVILEN